MKENIIFLDIDGVLNHEVWYNSKEYGSLEKLDRVRHLDPSSVKLINKLCLQANCKVVISSTWRVGMSLSDLQAMLDKAGATFKIIDVTGITREGIRGVEIYNWWQDKREDYNNYVIFDDDDDMLLDQVNNFFHIDGYCGITPTVIYRAERYLNTWERKL